MDKIGISGTEEKGNCHVEIDPNSKGLKINIQSVYGKAMEEEDIIGSFACADSTKYLVEILKKGRVKCILEGQCFDEEAIKSLRENPNRVIVDPSFYANYNSRGNAVYKEDVASGAKMCIIMALLLRDRIPVIVKDVTTVTAPGETVDVVVTDVGVAVNPRRKDLMEKFKDADLEVRDIKELQEEAYNIAGGPEKPETTDRIMAVIHYRDGSVIDIVKEVKE